VRSKDLHTVAIATFGRRDVAEKAMRFALGEHHNVEISSPAQFGIPDGTWTPDKNPQLTKLAEMFQVHFEQIILLDDDLNNVRAARAKGAKAWHTPKGLTPSVLNCVRVSCCVQKIWAKLHDNDLNNIKAARNRRLRYGTLPKA